MEQVKYIFIILALILIIGEIDTSDLGLSAGDQFGSSINVVGNYAVIGAAGADSVFVFDYNRTTGVFTNLFEIDAPTSNSEFGATIGIYNDEIYVGAPGESGDTGAVYKYNLLDSLPVSEQSIDLNIGNTSIGTIGSTALASLTDLSISNNITSISGRTGTANIIDRLSTNAMADNLVRMEAILNSNSERVNNELADLTEQKTHALNKFFETVETSPNGGKNSVLQILAFIFTHHHYLLLQQLTIMEHS